MTQRNAQAFYLSTGPTIAGPAIVPLTATAALPLILDDLTVSYDPAVYAGSTVTRITLAGQSLTASTQAFPLSGFRTDAFFLQPSQRSIGLTIDSNQQLFVEATLTDNVGAPLGPTANSPINMQCSTAPTNIVISPNALSGPGTPNLTNYVFGMGAQIIAPATTVVFNAVSLRDGVFLGRMIADIAFALPAPAQDPGTVTIESILIDGMEMMSNQTPQQANAMSLQALVSQSSTTDGIDYGVNQNSVVQITVRNTSVAVGANVVVALGFFCRPTI